EVYICTDLSVCERRDPKGLYKKARAGEIRNFTGIDSTYEAPEDPELVVDAGVLSIEGAAKEVFDYLVLRGYV
ncbi:adenylyl-sulfate kinase, partial [Oleiphilus sp. HI0086]